jgi:hypothetical protein
MRRLVYFLLGLAAGCWLRKVGDDLVSWTRGF